MRVENRGKGVLNSWDMVGAWEGGAWLLSCYVVLCVKVCVIVLSVSRFRGKKEKETEALCHHRSSRIQVIKPFYINMDKFGEYDKQNIPCLESVGNKINGDMYGDLKYYGNKIFW